MDQIQLISLLLALLFSFVSIFLGSHPVTKGSKLPRVTLVSDLDVFKQQLLTDIELLLRRYCTSKATFVSSDPQQPVMHQPVTQQSVTQQPINDIQQFLPLLLALYQLLTTQSSPERSSSEQPAPQQPAPQQPAPEQSSPQQSSPQQSSSAVHLSEGDV